MATNKHQIANLALSRIGSTKFVTDFDTDATAEARAIKQIYDLILDDILEAVRPQFALRRATLVEDTASTHADVEWAYKYSLPSALVCIVGLENAAGRLVRSDQRLAYALEHDGTKQVLMTDEADAVLIYVYRETTTTLYPPSFTSALAWQLAAELARSIKVSARLAAEADRMALIAIMEARAQAESQGETGGEPLPAELAARNS
ncbi:MAG: hypothetical protein P1V51_22370 [Deltaproteobacteria bacterium]|nr:hypothetical protein [Deltaproteobacteria bacterium]